ncbi:MAG: hypothetical protein R2825_13905 [Saprospiraceae bacterium]
MADNTEKEIKKWKDKTGMTEEENARLNKLNTLKNKLVNANGAYPQNMFISQVLFQ